MRLQAIHQKSAGLVRGLHLAHVRRSGEAQEPLNDRVLIGDIPADLAVIAVGAGEHLKRAHKHTNRNRLAGHFDVA